MAAAKIVGFEVTPTTEYSSTRDCRLPLRMRSRERSSSQTATPASESSARFSFCAMSTALLDPVGLVAPSRAGPYRGPPRACEWWGVGGPYTSGEEDGVLLRVVGSSGSSSLRHRSPVGWGRPPVAATGPAGTAAPDRAASRLSRAAATTASSVRPNSSYRTL